MAELNQDGDWVSDSYADLPPDEVDPWEDHENKDPK